MEYKKITTFKKACEVAKVDPNLLPEVSMLPEKYKKWLITAYKLGIITQAINTDQNGNVWEPDFTNSAQWKYYPYFWVDPSGFGFSGSDYGCTYAITDLGSRLCFDIREKVYHVQEHFEDLYKEFLLTMK